MPINKIFAAKRLYNFELLGNFQGVRQILKGFAWRLETVRRVRRNTSCLTSGPRSCQRPDGEQKIASGLYIASNAQEKPQRGEIIAVGAGKAGENGERLPMDVHVGDVVIYGKFGGNEVKVDGETYLLMRADDIYAVVE